MVDRKDETEVERRHREDAEANKARVADAGQSKPSGDIKPKSPPEGLAKVTGAVNADGPAKDSHTVTAEDRARDGRTEAKQHGDPQ